MSFMLTENQVCDESKDVTRRLGWANLKRRELVRAVKKAMGLQKGEKVRQLKIIRAVSVRREPLNAMLKDEAYGLQEVRREGFPDLTPKQFVRMFCRHMQCRSNKKITRIEFEYVK